MYFCKSPRRAISLFLLLAGLLSSSEMLRASSDGQPEVFLVGTIHDFHFDPKYHYSIPDLLEEVKELKPDAICGEIAPEAFQQILEGYFPPEATYLAEMATELHSRFVPSDWRGDSSKQEKIEAALPKQETAKLTEFWNRSVAGITNYKGVSLFDYFHSPGRLEQVDQFFESSIATDGDIALGYWHERNHKIVENCLQGAPGRKRIVFVFGASHIPQLQRELKSRGMEAVVASRLFTPAGLGQVPTAVVERWQRNLHGLEGVVSGSLPASEEYRSRVKNSNRINDLRRVIEIYSKQN
jgi:hypothetical protein